MGSWKVHNYTKSGVAHVCLHAVSSEGASGWDSGGARVCLHAGIVEVQVAGIVEVQVAGIVEVHVCAYMLG